MARTTAIEWADSTWSPWWGCTEISDGCKRCYARDGTGGSAWGNKPRVRTSPKYWREPLYWNADAPRFLREHGHRQRVFGGHICDVFDNHVDPQWRIEMFKLICETPNLDWLLLTKRPQNILKMLPADWNNGYPNLWLGISAEDEKNYRLRWPILAAIPAVIRFVSYEPALDPLGSIDIGVGVVPNWIICGGESGDGARMMDAQWACDVRDQCRRLGVAFFMKQMTGRAPIPPDLMVREWPQPHTAPAAANRANAERGLARNI
jgi:protein gp37